MPRRRSQVAIQGEDGFDSVRHLASPDYCQDILPGELDIAGISADLKQGSEWHLSRRIFLSGISLGLICGGLEGRGLVKRKNGSSDEDRYIREASFYEKLPYKKIRCQLCPRECVIDDAERGYCGVRENRDGVYYSLVYARPCTTHIDPIEKKPFFHFHPGTMAFSLATAGCNVNCKFCQNWQISQVRPEQIRSIYMPPERVTASALSAKCTSIAYTYSEPVVFFEFMRDTAKSASRSGVKSVVVTGGYIAQEPLKELCTLVDAIKVDLKAYSEDYYKKLVNGELKPVLDALVTMKKKGTWTELVYLVVPTLNDSDSELKGLARWIKSELGPDVPLHFSRFYPQYLLKNLPPTPIRTLERAKQIADAEGLKFVYIGNVPGHRAENTFCPGCGETVIERTGYLIKANKIKDGRCSGCSELIPGVWGT
jgi:pyruvate formate lyase activating enzyme